VPEFPFAIKAIIHDNLGAFDPDFDKMFDLLHEDGFQEFAHGRDTFANHLQGTFGTLAAWGQPQDVNRVGLFHSSFSGDLFMFHYLSDGEEGDREVLRDVIGEHAERLTHTFGITKRGWVNDTLFSQPDATLDGDTITVQARTNLTYFNLTISTKDSAKIMIASIADVFDQMLQVNAWREGHQQEVPTQLYPGQVRPDIGMHWMSRVCAGIRHLLEVVPPIFDHCTQELTYEDEVAARDAYWDVVLHEHEMTQDRRESVLRQCIAHNPFIAEPHLVLSQVYFQQGKYVDAVRKAKAALKLFYTWANTWDKRLPFRQWVSFTRIHLLRCQRKARGLFSLPENPGVKANVRKGMLQFGAVDDDRHVVPIKEMLKAM